MKFLVVTLVSFQSNVQLLMLAMPQPPPYYEIIQSESTDRSVILMPRGENITEMQEPLPFLISFLCFFWKASMHKPNARVH